MEASTGVSSHEVTITGQDGTARTIRVPVVQELARHGNNNSNDNNGIQDLLKMFTSNVSMTAGEGPPEDFPSVSMAGLRSKDPKERERELGRLAEGAEEWGMLLVSDHGIPFSLLGDVKEVINGFFGLSFKDKKKSVGTYASVDNMGYGRNYVKSKDQVLDWIDRLTMVATPQESTQGFNVWPQNPQNFREIIEMYAEEGRKLSDELLQALAESLSLDQDAFVKHFDQKSSEVKVRVNYYPPCPNPNSTIGLSQHSDPSGLSLLVQFHSSGVLQVLHKNNNKQNWVSVPWPVDGLLVIVGDLLEIMSNGRVKSPVHRAVTQPDVERCSVALFYNPPSSMEIEPVRRDDQEDDYKKVVVDDYVQHCYKVYPNQNKQDGIGFAMAYAPFSNSSLTI